MQVELTEADKRRIADAYLSGFTDMHVYDFPLQCEIFISHGKEPHRSTFNQVLPPVAASVAYGELVRAYLDKIKSIGRDEWQAKRNREIDELFNQVEEN